MVLLFGLSYIGWAVNLISLKFYPLTKECDGTIDATEFVNEPNMLDITGFPVGYTAEDYARDQDARLLVFYLLYTRPRSKSSTQNLVA